MKNLKQADKKNHLKLYLPNQNRTRLRKIEMKMKANHFIPSLMDGFNIYLESQKKNISKIGSYVNIVRKFHNYIGKSYIDVNRNDIENYLDFLIEFERLKQFTLYRHLTGLRLFYKYLAARGDLVKNPCDGIRIKSY